MGGGFTIRVRFQKNNTEIRTMERKDKVAMLLEIERHLSPICGGNNDRRPGSFTLK